MHGHKSSIRRNILRSKAALRKVRKFIDKTYYELKTTFKTPIALALFAYMILGFYLAYLLSSIYPLPMPIVGQLFAFLIFLCLVYSPVIIKTRAKIKEMDSDAKIRSEAWEGKKDTQTLVEEYQELLERKKKD